MKKLIVIAMSLVVMFSSLLANQVTRSGNQGLSSQQIKSYPIKTEVTGNRINLLNESFEGIFPPANWSLVDADGDSHNWKQSIPGLYPHTGTKCGVSESYLVSNIVLTPDNWMISPAIVIPAGSTTASVNWWDAAQDPDWPAEKYGLYVSTTNPTPASFTQLSETTLSTLDWTERTQDLTAYAGQTIYLAWRHFESTNNFLMKIDDVVVNAAGGADITAPDVASIAGLNSIPNTALNLRLVVSDESDVPATLTGIYNIGAGDVNFTMTKSTKAEFTYTGTIPAQAAGVSGSVKFNLIDNLNNQAWSSDYAIGWATPVSYVFNENFDAVTAPALPDGWTVEDTNGDGKQWKTYNGDQQSAPNALKMVFNADMDMDDWVYTPGFSPIPNTPYKLIFSYKRKSTSFAEKFEIKSGTSPASASMTTVLSAPIDVSLSTYVTDSVSFTSTSSDTIYIGFHGISEANMFNLYLDDIKLIGAFIDPIPPVAAAPTTGTTAAIGSAITIQTVVTDRTGIASVVGHYQINGGAWADFPMSASKATGTYTGTIPAQATAVPGKVKFTCTDTVTPTANTGDSPEFDISWFDPSQGMWVGNIYALNTSGLGMIGTPWRLGITLDLGSTNKNVSKISYMCNSGSNSAFNWSVLDMTDATTWSADVLAAGGELVANPIIGTTWNDVEVNDLTNLSGTVGLVVDLVAGGFFGRHPEGTNGNSYLYFEDAWIRLGEGLAEPYPGDWTLKCFVKDGVGIDQESEILPGKSELSQNYPNPFNPTTLINFYNNMTGSVKLTVMNAKGQTVATLINNKIAAGNHKVNFDGARFNSGVYFYKLETPTATITKKMLLIK